MDIKDYLSNKDFWDILCFDTLSSTNDEARRLGFDGAKEGTVISAKNQTNGRGSKGRTWLSADGEGLCFSVITRPNIAVDSVPAITLIAGLSVCTAIRRLTGIDALIKWPNDVVVGRRKICGILSESFASGYDLDFAVTGIGINCDTLCFPGELETIATSVIIESGRRINKARLLAEVLNEFEINYRAFVEDGFETVCEKYKALSAVLGKTVKIIGAQSFEAVAVDIGKGGELIVLEGNAERAVYSGEVSLRF